MAKQTNSKKRQPYKGVKIGPRSTMAIRFMAVIFGSDLPVTMLEACKKLDTSVSNLEDLVRKLKKKGLINSKAGATGGYSLGPSPYDISMASIIEAIEGGQKSDTVVGQVFSDLIIKDLKEVSLGDTFEQVSLIEDQ